MMAASAAVAPAAVTAAAAPVTASTVTSATAAAVAASAAVADKPYHRRCSIAFLVEDVERRQADIRDFFLA